MLRRALILATAVATPAAFAQWQQSAEPDQMSGKNVQLAAVSSKESLALAFPYSGKNFGHLLVRRHPKHGLDVIFRVDKGQLTCRPSECNIQIKFDDQQGRTFSGSGPADHSTNVIFISDTKRFLAQAKKVR